MWQDRQQGLQKQHALTLLEDSRHEELTRTRGACLISLPYLAMVQLLI